MNDNRNGNGRRKLDDVNEEIRQLKQTVQEHREMLALYDRSTEEFRNRMSNEVFALRGDVTELKQIVEPLKEVGGLAKDVNAGIAIWKRRKNAIKRGVLWVAGLLAAVWGYFNDMGHKLLELLGKFSE